ncbi:hypothetical protein [Sediminibacterium ginsengisoli]|uniref:Outer membrane insertion C-terminal signal n=1 Tax=Sediminibacterium ginsengisoli TaxID=413434 RepID=A0A1T4Q1F9_9BACT|nr:hypothetical protein [Sediminibacterium ginsengisoli]SJZ97544.1 hypothetical protein SAMN04488132_10788 [Sediminibacterium ginsengisoli]
MKKILLSMVLGGFVFFAGAQTTTNSYSYKTALGVKVWDGAGISLKHFVQGNNALEAVGFFWRDGFRLTGLYEIHGNINGAPGLKWYIGPGAHLGIYNPPGPNNSTTVGGIDGVLGLDYKINGAPINFSLDWQPSFEFGDNRGFVGSWGGFGVRYTF